MEEFNVLSLFDGMSCAMIALQKLGINPTNYYAGEIDKYAIQVSKANWPQIIHIGDVTKVSYKGGVLYTASGSYRVSFAKGLICGGSPCQGFSFAGKQLNFEDPRSKLFFEFVRIYNEIKAEHPDVRVFLENVVMKKEYQAVISEKLGVEPVLINSALVSAQNRKRLYWTNIPFQGQPPDRGILLKHILEYEIDDKLLLSDQEIERGINKAKGKVWSSGNRMGNMDFPNDIDKKAKSLCSIQITGSRETNHIGVVLNRGEYQERNEKAMCLDSNYWKGADNHGQRTMIQYISGVIWGRLKDDKWEQQLESNMLEKSNSLTTVEKDNVLIRQINPSKDAAGKQPYIQDRVYHTDYKSIAVTAEYASRLKVGETMLSYRKLTPVECERLQCVNDNYTKHVSDSQRYRMLGNGWNVDTIVHLFEPLLYMDIL